MPPFATACQCCSHGPINHSLTRCGCPYEGEVHTKHPIDDAHHRVWCTICLKYCKKDPKCPAVLPTFCLAQNRKGFKNHIISSCKALIASLRTSPDFLSTAKAWVRKRLTYWVKKPLRGIPNEKLAARAG